MAPWIPTGYGQQTAMFTPRIAALGHEVVLSAFVGIEGCVTSWNGHKVYPGDVSKLQKWSLKRIVAREAGDDDIRSVQVITLQDCWTWLEAAYGGIADWHGLKIASWCPVDHDPIPPGVVRALREYESRPIAMSRFGQTQLQKFEFDPLYVPHGVETSILKPLPSEIRDGVREQMGIPKDAVLFGMVSNNNGIAPPRKAFPQVFEAFAMLAQKRDDVFLYMHTDEYGINQGLNLLALANLYNISDRVKFVQNDPYWWGEIQPQHMSAIYNALDCLLCPSYGEGFGIPIIEAQACGTPVIVNNWTSMPELVGAGWIAEGEPYYNPGAGSRWKLVSIGDLYEKMELAYESAGDQDLRHRARVFAEAYDADLITEKYWKPTLAALEAPREVAPLPNRAARRHRNKRKAAA